MYLEREITKDFLGNLANDLILILLGARQVGKTTFLRHTYQQVDGRKYFVNLENPEYLSLLNEHPENVFKITNSTPSESQKIFLDEIQYLDNPSNFLKYIYDEYKGKVKLIVSGSSSFYIDKKFKDSLMGRKRLFYLYQFNFREFLFSKQEESLIGEYDDTGTVSLLNQNKINQYFSEYVTYGGYPAVVLESDSKMKELVLEEIANDYIKKDIYEANIQDQDKYYFVLKLLANGVGNLVNAGEISNTLNISFNTVEKYLYIMQKSFQVALIRPFYKNIRKELTKMPKAYFYDLGLRNSLVRSFEHIDLRHDRGALLENIVFREILLKSDIDAIKFWRTQSKNEVDFVIDEKKAYEVKYAASECKVEKYYKFIENYKSIDFSFINIDNVISLCLSRTLI